MPITKLIEEIANSDKSLVASHLTDLSQITATDMAIFKRAWTTIATERRRQIITRLGDLTKDNVELNFDLVFRHALVDSDTQIRISAIEGLWENEDPSMIQTFIKIMENDTSNEVQASAASALGKFAAMVEYGEIRESYRTALGRALLNKFNDTNVPVEVRRRALESAAPLSLPAVRESIKTAYDSRDERLVISAVYAMGKTCDDSWLPVLYKEMSNADAEIRYEAANACGEIGLEASASHLMEHIHDTDIEVRMAVIQALGKIGGIEAKKALQRLANDQNPAIREAVENALSQIETMEDMTLLEMDAPGEINDRRN